MKPPLLKSILRAYSSRHRNHLNKLLHIIGIPLAIFGVFKLFYAGWGIGLISFFLGYLLQYVGHHMFEKNMTGEEILIKRIIGKVMGS